jgi:hypothetical protein
VRQLIPRLLKDYGKRQEMPEELGHQTFNQEVVVRFPPRSPAKSATYTSKSIVLLPRNRNWEAHGKQQRSQLHSPATGKVLARPRRSATQIPPFLRFQWLHRLADGFFRFAAGPYRGRHRCQPSASADTPLRQCARLLHRVKTRKLMATLKEFFLVLGRGKGESRPEGVPSMIAHIIFQIFSNIISLVAPSTAIDQDTRQSLPNLQGHQYESLAAR